MALDFPEFDLPANATSRPLIGGKAADARDAGEEAGLTVVEHGSQDSHAQFAIAIRPAPAFHISGIKLTAFSCVAI